MVTVWEVERGGGKELEIGLDGIQTASRDTPGGWLLEFMSVQHLRSYQDGY